MMRGVRVGQMRLKKRTGPADNGVSDKGAGVAGSGNDPFPRTEPCAPEEGTTEMRTSRLIFAGVGVAAAVAGTSAFTGSNSISPASNLAGYGEATVTGATVTDIVYTPASADATKLHTVVLTSSTDITHKVALMTLKLAGTQVGPPTSCTVGTTYTTTVDVTCTLATDTLFTAFHTIALTVADTPRSSSHH